MSSRFVAAKRVALCALGILLVSFGVALTASSNLGTSPISSVAWVAHCVSVESDYLPRLTFGTTTLILNLLFFFVQWAIQGRSFGKTSILTDSLYLSFRNSDRPKHGFMRVPPRVVLSAQGHGGCRWMRVRRNGVGLRIRRRRPLSPRRRRRQDACKRH